MEQKQLTNQQYLTFIKLKMDILNYQDILKNAFDIAVNEWK